VTICNPDITPTVNNPCPGARTYSDHGTVTLTVGGHSNSVNYNASETSSTVAQALQTAINGDAGALIHVTSVSGGSLSVQSVAAGAGANYSWSISSQSLDTTGNFGPGPGPFSGSPGTLSGGANADPGITVYDKGTLTLKVGSFSGQVCYGTSSDCSAPPPSCPTGNSTAVQVACIAASVLNSSGSPVSATYSGTATLTIKDKTAGQGGNGLSVTVTPASTQTLTTFSPPSFSSAGATLGSGMNAGDVSNQPFVTVYSYDALGDLICVEQHGGVTGTGCSAAPTSDAASPWRVRRFTYDSLSRLLTAHNPESGTITYSYDADGNLLQKTSPAPNQTGAATQTISYCYDGLHRVTGKA
jgi:YD repeat-containing protein